MSPIQPDKKFGTLEVFLTSICTILGAILFLRFGWAVGHVGLALTLLIVVIGHMVTIPTSLAIAEIATNQRVEGGGAYYIISRSFGLNIGGAIGLTLYFSQAISVAFYVIAFAQSSAPIFDWIQSEFGLTIEHYGYRLVSIPSMALIGLLVMTRGANSGMNILYVVAGILGLSLLMFFLGSPEGDTNWANGTNVFTRSYSPDAFSDEQKTDLGLNGVENAPFFYVFTIIFPAFTGIIAGLGLSGDLKDPGKSIPLGTIAATLTGMVIYLMVAVKLAISLPPEILANKDRLVMADIAIWAPIIPIGLAAAAVSSALGSILVAPRTLQALGGDRVLPSIRANNWLAKLRPKDSEPYHSTLVSVLIASVFVLVGDVDVVAEIISMFFMVTYGAICLISFLEHASANPAYRPTFTSRWYFSLPGAVLCIWLMFQMNAPYAIGSLVSMVAIYFWLSRSSTKVNGMARIFQGVIFQISRWLRVVLQNSGVEDNDDEYWVPSIISFTEKSFERQGAFDTVRFISHKYGFGTYVHFVKGEYSRNNLLESSTVHKRLLHRTKVSNSKVFVDTLIAPDYATGLIQSLQMPGISGRDNNIILFEYSKNLIEEVTEMVDHLGLISAADFDICVLRSTEKAFGYRSEIHIWLSSSDFVNGNFMILLAYIILGHPEWKGAEIKIFAMYSEAKAAAQKEKLLQLIAAGRLAISPNNVEVIARKENDSIKDIINTTSGDADLTIIGFTRASVTDNYHEVFDGFDQLGNIMFVNTEKEKVIQ